MLTASNTDTAPECMCGILPSQDRDKCPVHGTDAQAAQAPHRISVGRTQPLYAVSPSCSALDKIEDIVNQTMIAGEFSNRQLGIMRWAIRMCRSVASDLRQLDVAEL